MKGGRAGLQSSLCFWRLMTQLAALGCVSDILQTSSPVSLPSTFCSLELIQCISDYYVMRQRGRGGWEGRAGAGRSEQAGRGRGPGLRAWRVTTLNIAALLETQSSRCLLTAPELSEVRVWRAPSSRNPAANRDNTKKKLELGSGEELPANSHPRRWGAEPGSVGPAPVLPYPQLSTLRAPSNQPTVPARLQPAL